jgi:hypothetical protein
MLSNRDQGMHVQKRRGTIRGQFVIFTGGISKTFANATLEVQIPEAFLMPLERWQKYLKNNPCPICGGTTSGRKGSKCKGYLHEDRKHAFCQRRRSAYSLNVQGLVLYKHELEATQSRQTQNPQEGAKRRILGRRSHQL